MILKGKPCLVEKAFMANYEQSLDETLYIMRLMDDLRYKWGVHYPMDKR